MALKITRMLVPQNKYSKKCPFKMTPKGIAYIIRQTKHRLVRSILHDPEQQCGIIPCGD